ncbi:hypothetical protein N7456_013665 [Penicillium angulare]|uniref:Uncharacterized protein n=1 Tax=Penicillium angulare TaxID=116970 RepID=A0A9W9JT54_9EURO|nr:hypothetical protein N7456_013665 [Penicillium angulare]
MSNASNSIDDDGTTPAVVNDGFKTFIPRLDKLIQDYRDESSRYHDEQLKLDEALEQLKRDEALAREQLKRDDARERLKLDEAREQLKQHNFNAHINERAQIFRTWTKESLGNGNPAETHDSPGETALHSGDIIADSWMVTLRFDENAPQRKYFSVLYGLSASEAYDMHQVFKYHLRLTGYLKGVAEDMLDRKSALPRQTLQEKRQELIKLLREGKFREADSMAGRFIEEEVEDWPGSD